MIFLVVITLVKAVKCGNICKNCSYLHEYSTLITMNGEFIIEIYW
jgi:hypothetical protein